MSEDNSAKQAKDRELLRIASNFSIAGAVLVTAVTIAAKDMRPVASTTTTASGAPQTINVRVVEMPELEMPELEAKVKGQIGIDGFVSTMEY